jgi:hypothetical protein
MIIKTGARSVHPKLDMPPGVIPAAMVERIGKAGLAKLIQPPSPAPAKLEPFGPGVYPGIKNRDYHADPALGSTSLKTLALRTPAHWKWESEHPVHKDVYDIGTLAHSLILEEDTTLHQVIDVEDKRGNKWTIPANEAKANGLIPVTPKEWAGIVAMRDSVMAHPLARNAFTGHRAEESVFWDEDGQMFKARPDAWKPGLVADLKTTVDANPNEFGKTAFNFGYFMSAAHYIDGVKSATGEDVKFSFVNVEKTAPYLVSVVELDDYTLDCGRQMLERAKTIYRECTETGNWPGYPSVEPVGLPAYANYQLDDLLGLSIEGDIF